MLKKIIRFSGISTAVSALLMASLGIPVLLWLGPYLALGISLYAGHMEPVVPEVPLPWGIIMGLLIGSALVLSQARRHEALPWVATGLALAAVVAEGMHLLALVERAKGGSGL